MHNLNDSNFCLDSDQGHSHPMLAWDCMPPSGGSQLHTHMHGFVGRGHKLGHFRRCRETGLDFLFLLNIHAVVDFSTAFVLMTLERKIN